jgi:benzaldehyde dehydrogenase (NAD)
MGELLGTAAWAGKIYSGGWVDGGGHTFASVEPATRWQLADVGSAAPDDVRRAVQRCAAILGDTLRPSSDGATSSPAEASGEP